MKAPENTSSRSLRYLSCIGGFLFALYVMPLLLLRIPDFSHWCGCMFGPALEYSYTDAKVNADIVIFGDSSALFGIDPLQIATSSGQSVINLPNILANLPVTNDMSLRHYLQNNAAPKLVVFYFAPWNLNYGDSVRDRRFEGVEMLGRHGAFRDIATFGMANPRDLLLFPFQFYLIHTIAGTIRSYWHPMLPVVAAKGHMELHVNETDRLKSECEIPTDLLQAARIDSARKLRDEYRNAQTKIMFYMAPIPSCRNAGSLTDVTYTQLSASPPRQLDPHYFWDDGYFIHIDASAVADTTNGLISAIIDAQKAP